MTARITNAKISALLWKKQAVVCFAIIGTGSATSLACEAELACLGYGVEIFEKITLAGGMTF